MIRLAAFIFFAWVGGVFADEPGGSVSYMANPQVSHRPQPSDFQDARFPESELRTLNTLLAKCEIVADWEPEGWHEWDSYTLSGKFAYGDEKIGLIRVVALSKPSKQPDGPFIVHIVQLHSREKVLYTRNSAFVTYVTGKFSQKLVEWNPELKERPFFRLGDHANLNENGAQPADARNGK